MKCQRCQRCQSPRVVMIQAKANDGFSFLISETGFQTDEQGYAPSVKNVTDSGDYMCPEFCLECGQIQGKFPVILKSHLIKGGKY